MYSCFSELLGPYLERLRRSVLAIALGYGRHSSVEAFRLQSELTSPDRSWVEKQPVTNQYDQTRRFIPGNKSPALAVYTG